MKNILKGVIDSHEAKNSKWKLSVSHRKMAVNGLRRVQLALQSSLKPRLIEESFLETGIYPYNPLKILRLCDVDLTLEEENTIVEKIPTFIDIMGAKGEIPDEDFNMHNIATKGNNCVKKERPPHDSPS